MYRIISCVTRMTLLLLSVHYDAIRYSSETMKCLQTHSLSQFYFITITINIITNNIMAFLVCMHIFTSIFGSIIFFCGATAQIGPRLPFLRSLVHTQLDTHTHTHTRARGRTLNSSARRKGIYVHNI